MQRYAQTLARHWLPRRHGIVRLALLIFDWFPHGGLQRDCIGIAERLRDRGHEVSIFTRTWKGEQPSGIAVRLRRAEGLTNHGRDRAFATGVSEALGQGAFDGVIGFNKMAGLDVYYAGDPCFAARARRHPVLYALTRRHRVRMRMERAVFGPDTRTEILLLSEVQRDAYQRAHGTLANRLHLVPPGIAPACQRPDAYAAIREEARATLGVPAHESVLLLVGSRFRTKGVDRAIAALASLPAEQRARTRLVVVGSDKPERYVRLAKRRGVGERVVFLGGRDDVPRLLLAADLLLHPAVHDNTGQAILEAVVAGLPVLATASCGFARHVELADAGQVLPEPFDQAALNKLLARMLTDKAALKRWSNNGASYGRTQDLYRGLDVAADLIERIVAQRYGSPVSR
jgi:UDP-glucose:(heptosyl)LPS alpha-1,3-glucosyltransferase